jgi:hypothetical protein
VLLVVLFLLATVLATVLATLQDEAAENGLTVTGL